MKYDTPELTELTSAIRAVQTPINKDGPSSLDGGAFDEGVPAYADWED